MKEHGRLDSFDCLKGIACIAVVLIHFNFPGNFGLAVKAFCRFAVPVFFMISGFFFMKGGVFDEAKTVKKIRHTLKLLLISGIFYSVFTLLNGILFINGWVTSTYVTNLFRADKIVRFFITNDPFAYSHLWFLLALLYCYVFALIFFGGKRKNTVIKYLAPLLLIMYTCMQEFGGHIGIKVSYAITGTDSSIWLYNCFIFRALPFFLFGMLLAEHRKYLAELRIKKVALVLLCVLGGGLAILERLYISEAQFFIGSYITVASLFILALKTPMGGGRILRHIGRDLSLCVYIVHIAVGRILDLIFNPLIETDFYAYTKWLMVIIASLGISELVFMIKKVFMSTKADLSAKSPQ